MAMLLLTVMDAGQGGSVTLSDKSKAKPAWFNNDAGWTKYTQPSSATLEENTDLILGIFRFHGLDPKTHNLRSLALADPNFWQYFVHMLNTVPLPGLIDLLDDSLKNSVSPSFDFNSAM